MIRLTIPHATWTRLGDTHIEAYQESGTSVLVTSDDGRNFEIEADGPIRFRELEGAPRREIGVECVQVFRDPVAWVIRHDDREYGTAAEVAARLGGDVTVAMVRNWAQRDGLTAHRDGRTVYYPLDQAAEIEHAKRHATRGRPRQLDSTLVSAAWFDHSAVRRSVPTTR